ncbi:MAG: SMP-30/gluconolactonase/LRE family protein [Chloroflexota bacterium]
MERRDDVELLHAAGASVGEGPVWDERTGELLWVDILGQAVHRWDRSTDRPLDPLVTPKHVGAAVLRAGGGLVLALQDGFWVTDGWEAPRLLTTVGPDDPSCRFNDGKVDPQGRFWAGTMEYDGADDRGVLYRLDPDGTVTPHVTGVRISNGLAWTADSRTLYFIDSLAYSVDAFDFDPVAGSLSGRRVAVAFERDGSVPDGMCIDAEGQLWVAFFGGSCVRRYDPVSGECSVRIDLPAPNITSCAFGGPDLDELYITSSARDHDAAGLARYPAAGGLFRIRPGVRGLLSDRFAG